MPSVKDLERTYSAAADLSNFQYTFMRQTAARQVNLFTTPLSGGIYGPVGVLQDKPNAAGNPGLVRHGGTSQVFAGGAITQGALVTLNVSGQVINANSIQEWIVGKALTTAGAAGELIEVALHTPSYIGSGGAIRPHGG